MQKSTSKSTVNKEPAASHRKSAAAVTAKFLDTVLSVIHVIGERLLGSLWILLFETVQDAITLALLAAIPGRMVKVIIGQEFSGLDQCVVGNTIWSSRLYACSTIVIAEYAMWAVLIYRILFRCYIKLREPLERKK